MSDPTAPRALDASRSVARDAIAIVVTGVVLGLSFNYFGLLERPSRGLAWIKTEVPLESVEMLVTDTTSSRPSTAASASVPAPAPPTGFDPRPATVTDGSSQAARGTPSATRSAAPPAATSAPEPTGSSPAPAVTPADPVVDPRAGLPVIPDVDRPLKAELATVKKFFDAKAAVIVDAREAAEFAEGHIPGAINIPIDEAGSRPELLEGLDAGEGPIIIYCGGGKCEASKMLAEALIHEFKKRRVLVYEGGYPEWAAAGHPVAKGGG